MGEVVKFKTAQGVFVLRGLFYEETLADKTGVLYTLKDQDHEGYPSLRRLYLETADPTEYTFAMKYLSGWAHWERLCESDWFVPYINRWRKELELTLRAKALSNIIDMAEAGGKESFNANKYLLNSSWKVGEHRAVGRPTKQDIKSKALQMIDAQEIKNDAKRLFA